MILIGAVAMTKFRRVYEAAIFKTLGATRRLIAAVLLLEYGLLGILAGGIGAGGAIGAHVGDQPYALEIPFKPLIGMSAVGVVITTLLVAAIGVISSWEVLQRKPLATLRAVVRLRQRSAGSRTGRAIIGVYGTTRWGKWE